MPLDNNVYQNTINPSGQPVKTPSLLDRIRDLTSKINLKILSLVLVLLAVPVTVFMAMQQQEIRQRAAGPENSSTVSQETPWKGYIFKLKTSVLPLGKTSSLSANQSFNIQLTSDREAFKGQVLKILNKKSFTSVGKNEEIDQVSGDENVNIIGQYSNSFNGVALDVTDAQAQLLKNSPLVDKIYKNYQVKKTLYQSVPLIQAPTVWQQKDTLGRQITGQGEKIAIIDTGVDYTHPSLGATNITERTFTKISNIANPLDWDSMMFQLNDNRLAYIKGPDKISIYKFNTGVTAQIPLNTSAFIKNSTIQVMRLDGNNIAYYANNNNSGALLVYNISTKKTKKIADLTLKKNNWAYVGLFTVSGGYVYFTKAVNDAPSGQQPFKLIKYKISTGEKTTLASDVNDGLFYKYGNIIAYENPPSSQTFCNPRNIILQDITTGVKKTISSQNIGVLQDYNYGKLIYFSPCSAADSGKSLYLYDINTALEKKISYSKDITGKDVSSQSHLTVSYISPYAVKIGDGVVFFNKNMPNITEKLIAYDYVRDRYAQITLKTGIGLGLTVEGKRVCFFKNSDFQLYCHDYNPDYNYPLPDHIFNSKVIGGFNFLTGEEDPFDDNGHGTHVAGIAAGNGNLKGVAPDAQIIAYKVLDADALGYVSDVLLAIDKSIDTRLDSDSTNNIDVINLSLGMDCYPNYSQDCGPDDILSQSLDRAVDAGIEVTVAAGNSGPDIKTIDSPATSRKAISVGSISKSKSISLFSSRGPLIWNGENINKPDIVAPGEDICSARMFGLPSDNCKYSGDIFMSGTSMASPHLAGVVALIRQAKPDFSPEQIKALIKNNAVDLGYSYDIQGAGMVDLKKIFNALGNTVSISQTPTPTQVSLVTPTPTLIPTQTLTPTITPLVPTSTPTPTVQIPTPTPTIH